MDYTFIEDESIHISIPYSSYPNLPFFSSKESIEEGEHQISRIFQATGIGINKYHKKALPDWPNENPKVQESRPNTFIVSVPVEKHVVEDSLSLDEGESFVKSQNFLYYGETGKVVYNAFYCKNNLESRVIEEFLVDPDGLALVLENCKEFVGEEFSILSKIVIDLMVEYWKSRDYKKMFEWVTIAKGFYMRLEFPILTNFMVEGILHFEDQEEYLEYYEKILS